jgi:hypothetical protein
VWLEPKPVTSPCGPAVRLPWSGPYSSSTSFSFQDLGTALDTAAASYFRLVLVVGPSGSGKSKRLRELANTRGFPRVSLSGLAASRLLELSERQRWLGVFDIVDSLIDEAGGSVTLLDEIELLFQPSLAADPLRVLQASSRNRTIVAAWPGVYADGLLTYADPSHPEYRVYQSPEAVVLNPDAPLDPGPRP